MLYVVGFGAGNYNGMTIAAKQAVKSSDIIVGYTVYTEIMKSYFPEKTYLTTPMKQERERVLLALDETANGKIVSLICSGDSEVYGMAGLVIEMSTNYPTVEIEVLPGVTAALSGGAVLGAPLTCDFAVISLSDILIPWNKIEKKLRCAAEADFVTVIYNPSSKKRADYLEKACDIMLEYKNAYTVCGLVRNIGRKGQESRIISLSELRNTTVDMFTTVFIGSNDTKKINGKMVTSRGYKNV